MIRAFLLIFLAASLGAQETKDLATLRYIEVQVGTGVPAAAGKRFTVHYTGWLKDGTKFDSSRDRDQPIKFVQGRKQVITGWDIGFEGMKVGGKRKLIIPYQLAYGEAGTGPIPPKAELTFDVELVDVTDAGPVLPAIDILVPYKDLTGRAIALANPERLQNDALATIFRRIIFFNTQYLAAASKDDPILYQTDLNESDIPPVAKDQIPARLSESFDAVRKELEIARNGSLTADALFLGQNTTRRGIFTELAVAVAEQVARADTIVKQN